MFSLQKIAAEDSNPINASQTGSSQIPTTEISGEDIVTDLPGKMTLESDNGKHTVSRNLPGKMTLESDHSAQNLPGKMTLETEERQLPGKMTLENQTKKSEGETKKPENPLDANIQGTLIDSQHTGITSSQT